MSSEQVSDGRLDKELAVVKGGIDTNAERDEEARLARKIAESSVPHLITDKGKQDLYPLAGIDVGRFAAAIETKLRAHLAERDARERMVREQVKSLLVDDDQATIGEACYQKAVRDVLGIIDAALSAKSDEL